VEQKMAKVIYFNFFPESRDTIRLNTQWNIVLFEFQLSHTEGIRTGSILWYCFFKKTYQHFQNHSKHVDTS